MQKDICSRTHCYTPCLVGTVSGRQMKQNCIRLNSMDLRWDCNNNDTYTSSQGINDLCQPNVNITNYD